MRGSWLAVVVVTGACSSYADADSPTTSPANDGGGGNNSGPPNVDGGTGSGTNDGGANARAVPPAAGPLNAPDGHDAIYVISKMFVGDENPDGTKAAADAWKHYGYDLDGKNSDANSTDGCKPRGQGTAANQVDGDGGRDNSYGKNLLPLSVAAGGSTSQTATVNNGLAAGKATSIFVLKALGSETSYNPFTSVELTSLDLGAAPKRDGSDIFRISASSVDGDVSKPKTSHTASYLVDNTWVSGPLAATTITLPMFPNAPLSRAIVTMQLSADHKRATNGVIAAIITVDAAKQAFIDAAGALDPSLCSGATIDSLLAHFDAAADIMADGSQDPSKVCDAISIGVGFEAELAQLGQVAPAPSTTSPCPPK